MANHAANSCKAFVQFKGASGVIFNKLSNLSNVVSMKACFWSVILPLF